MRSPDEIWNEWKAFPKDKIELTSKKQEKDAKRLLNEMIVAQELRDKLAADWKGNNLLYASTKFQLLYCEAVAEKLKAGLLSPEIISKYLELPMPNGKDAEKADRWLWMLRAVCMLPGADSKVLAYFMRIADNTSFKDLKEKLNPSLWSNLPLELKLQLLQRLAKLCTDEKTRSEFVSWAESVTTSIAAAKKTAENTPPVQPLVAPASPPVVPEVPKPVEEAKPEPVSEPLPEAEEPQPAVKAASKKKMRTEAVATAATVDFTPLVELLVERLAPREPDFSPVHAAIEKQRKVIATGFDEQGKVFATRFDELKQMLSSKNEEELSRERARAEKLQEANDRLNKDLDAANELAESNVKDLAAARAEVEAEKLRAEEYIQTGERRQADTLRTFQSKLWNKLKSDLEKLEDPESFKVSEGTGLVLLNQLHMIREILKAENVPPKPTP